MSRSNIRWLTGTKDDLIVNGGSWQSQFPPCCLQGSGNRLPSSSCSAKTGSGGAVGILAAPGQSADPARTPLSGHFLMGIVNLTPDSFSDGGCFASPEAGLSQALRLAEAGADILDLGAESTRPGADEVSAESEQGRLLPVLVPLRRELAGIYSRASGDSDGKGKCPAISIDTFKASTAKVCLENGADIINDVSGCLFDPELADVLAQFKPAYVLGHSPARPREMQKNPRYANVVEDLVDYFEGRMEVLIRAGLPEEHIALDPCIGFGKKLEHNLAVLNGTERFLSLGRPLFMAFSRKALFRELLAMLPGDNDKLDTVTQVALGILAARHGDGVIIHRVHQVRGAVSALRLASQLQGT